jgi:hypothetical protein
VTLLQTVSNLQPLVVIAVLLATLWLLAAGLALILRPHSAPAENRTRRVILGIVSLALGVSWIFAFGPPLSRDSNVEVTRLSAIGAVNVSCATVSAGMPATVVRKLLGDPGTTLPTVETRGPRTEVWLYDLCTVHMIGDTVDLVE